MLVDSGSEISCIAQRTFEELKGRNKDLKILPAVTTHVIGVTGGNSEPCRWQVYIEVQLPDGRQLEFASLIVKNLTKPLIMGADALQHYGAVMNLKRGEYYFSCLETMKSNSDDHVEMQLDAHKSERNILTREVIARNIDAKKLLKDDMRCQRTNEEVLCDLERLQQIRSIDGQEDSRFTQPSNKRKEDNTSDDVNAMRRLQEGTTSDAELSQT